MFDFYAVCFFFGFGLLFTAAELTRPARAIDHGAVVGGDVGALLAYQFIFAPGAFYATEWLIRPGDLVFRSPTGVPWPVRIVLYVVLTDLGSYAFHRAMHSRHLWRVHRWHHSPGHMYWLAGFRATLPQQALFNVSGALCAPLLVGAPGWAFLAVFAVPFASNNWMHANLTWRSRWLEWIVVTPRYHHVHPSADPRHHGMNLGVLFTVWDRLFGTYVDPEEIDVRAFGIGIPVPPVRLALGL